MQDGALKVGPKPSLAVNTLLKSLSPTAKRRSCWGVRLSSGPSRTASSSGSGAHAATRPRIRLDRASDRERMDCLERCDEEVESRGLVDFGCMVIAFKNIVFKVVSLKLVSANFLLNVRE